MFDARNEIRQYAVVSPPRDPPGITIGCGMAVPDERAGDGAELVPGRRRLEPDGLELAAPVPEPGDVRERGDAEGATLVPVRGDERVEEVHLVLVAHPVLVQILERVQEARRRELGRPDGVEDGEVGRLTFRDGMGECLVKVGARR